MPFDEQEPPYLLEEVTIVGATVRAIRVRFEDWSSEWIPVSQINWSDSDIAQLGEIGTLAVSRWLARKKGWLSHVDD